MSNAFSKLLAIRDAISIGETLSKPGVAGNRAIVGNAIYGALGIAVVFVPNLHLSEADMQAIAGGAAVLVGVLNGFFHAATNKDVGLPPRRK